MPRISGTSGGGGNSSGGVSGISPTEVDAIARWADTTGTSIKNSETVIQDSGAIEAQGFLTRRTIDSNIKVNPGESWIAPELELTLTGSIEIELDGELIIV